MNKVDQLKIKCNNETFTRGTYNGISVIIRDKDGYINATDMCKQFNRRFAKINENHSWQQYFEAFKAEYYVLPEMGEPIYVLKKGYTNEIRGTYVDPRIVNYIAIWASPTYAIYVGKIMDSINDKVHEVLTSQQLPDTPENANPAFVEVVKQIAPSVDIGLINKKCWGYRERFHELDQWEQDDLRRDVNEYEEMKKRIEELEKKVNKWGSYVKQYCPEFKNEDEEKKKRIDELEKKVNKLGSYVKQYCPEFVKIDEF